MQFEEQCPANKTTSRSLQHHIFSLLHNCKSLRNLAQIHAHVLLNGFSQKSHLLVKLLSLYISSGHLASAQSVFDNSRNPSPTLWNLMIRGYSRSGNPRKALEFLNRMVGTDAEPNGFTYSSVLSGCVRSGLVREGKQVHGRVLASGYCSNVFVMTNLVNLYWVGGGVSGVEYARRVFDEMTERNVSTWNSVLSGYVRCGDIDGARRIFDEMPERNVVSWTTMIAGCARNGKCKQALSLFNEMRRAQVELDQVALVAALSACAELGDLILGQWIHSHATDFFSSGRPLLISLNNALIHMYASCGEIEEAYEIFRHMPRRNTVSWTSMITAFAKQGYANEALGIFELMQSLGSNEARPDEITFIGVLCACSHAGYVDEGRQFFKNMIQTYGIKPRIEHYGCMVDLLSRAGFLDEAHDLIKNMNIKPNDAVWGALLGGCRIHKNAEIASHVAQNLTNELDPQRAAGYLVLLAHVHASAKRWEDVAFARQKIVEMGTGKPAGRSWIQIDGKVHDFVAGDTTHTHTSSIYEALGEITLEAKMDMYPRQMEYLYSS